MHTTLRFTRLVKLKEVLTIVPYGKSTLYNKIAKGEFPKQIRIGPRAVAWKLDEVIEFVERLLSQNSDQI